MSRGRLEPPNLDDRTWQEIVDQARDLIPTYAPEWTDHGPSDPGITIVELLAWISESQTYRLNRVPEKHIREFLTLIGAAPYPATAASAQLVFKMAPGSPRLTVLQGSQVVAPGARAEEEVVFVTEAPVDLLPVNLEAALLSRKGAGGDQALEDVSAALVSSPLTGYQFEIEAEQENVINLGFDAATIEEIALDFRLIEPVRVSGPDNRAIVTGLYFQPVATGLGWLPQRLPLTDGTNGLQKNGKVRVTVPDDWSQYELEEQELFWVVLKIQAQTEPLRFELAHILFNRAPASNTLSIEESELLGVSNGRPLQSFYLSHRSVFKQPGVLDPYAHLRIEVREPSEHEGEFTEWEAWTRVEEFPDGNGKEYRLDAASGAIYLGNHDIETGEGHGRIPPLDSEIRAASYRYVANGANGNVPPGAVSVVRSASPEVQSVTNPGPATGGKDEEPLAEAKRRAPELLRRRFRAITVEDYEHLTREADPEVRKVCCLPPRLFTEDEARSTGIVTRDCWTYGGLNRSTNCVNVIIVPDLPQSESRPQPSVALLQEVSDYLQERRALTSLLHVTGPRYLPVKISVEVMLWPEAISDGLVTQAGVEDDIRNRIVAFLHPLYGGAEGQGWEIGQDFTIPALLEHIQLAPNIGFIANIVAEAHDPAYMPQSRPGFMEASDFFVPIADYELLCSAEPGDHEVTVSVVGEP